MSRFHLPIAPPSRCGRDACCWYGPLLSLRSSPMRSWLSASPRQRISRTRSNRRSPSRRGGRDDGDCNTAGMADGLPVDWPAASGARDARDASGSQRGRPLNGGARGQFRNFSIFASSAALIWRLPRLGSRRMGLGASSSPWPTVSIWVGPGLVAGPAGTLLRHGDAAGASPLCSAQCSAPNIFTKSD